MEVWTIKRPEAVINFLFNFKVWGIKICGDCTINLEAQAIWSPPGAVLENKRMFWKVYFNIKSGVSKVEELKVF